LPAYWSIVGRSCGYGCGRPVVIVMVMVDSSSSCWRKALSHSPFHFGRTKQSRRRRHHRHLRSSGLNSKRSLKMTPVSTDLLLTSSYSCREGSTARLREKRRGCASASEDGCLVSLRTTPAAESLASVRRTDDTHTHTHGGGGGIGSDCSTDRI
jgi:hypothetical protein